MRPLTSIRRHPYRFLATSLGTLLGYHLLLAALVLVRFEAWPNYFRHYDVFSNLQLIFNGTPSLWDALPLAIQEPWLEFGYANPDYYGIAEWSYLILPSRLMLLTVSACLLGVAVVSVRQPLSPGLSGETCRVQSRRHVRSTLLASGLGGGLLGLGCSTLTWVVCCATPSWVVVLSMLGLSAELSLTLEPLGTFFILGGLALQVLLLWILLRRAQPAPSSHASQPHSYSLIRPLFGGQK